MNCVIPGGNMKVINKALHALSRLSDELYIECKPNLLSLVAMNSNKTAYSKYDFQLMFFQSYEVKIIEPQLNVTCKLLLKAMLNIFKQKMDRKIEVCKIELDSDATRIIFKLRYKHDVTIVHRLKLMDTDYLTFEYDIGEANNKISVDGVFLNQILSNFSLTDSSLSLEVGDVSTILRNYDVGESTIYKGIRSQIVLASNEFHEYQISLETSIVLPLKPFRSAIQFAEHFNLLIQIHFQFGGCPIILCMKNNTFNVDYVFATISPDGFTQTTTTTGYTNLAVNRKGSQNTDISIHDQAALESINWDNDFNEAGPQKSPGAQSNLATIGSSDKNSNDLTPPHKSMDSNHFKGKSKRRIDPFEAINKSPCDESLGNFDEDSINESPESKRARLIFGRCFDPTFQTSMLDFGDVLVANSDSD